MPFTYRELRRAAKTRLKHKGLRGSNTPKESQDFVTGLGDAVDSGPAVGGPPTGGGYGEGANMKQVEKASTKEIITKKVIPYLEKTTGQEYEAYKCKLTGEWYPRPKASVMKNKVKVKQPLKGPKGQETAKSLSGSDLEWWKGLSKEKQAKYVKEHPNSKYAKHSGGSGLGKWSDHTKNMKAKKDKPEKKAKSGKSHNINIFSRLSGAIEARLSDEA